jgi:hypothetical protein
MWTPNPPAPKGWQASIVSSRDSLASLESELRIPAHEIAKANGVPWPGRKTCVWGRDIAAWVLDEKDVVAGKGGFRRAVSPSSPNTCEPGLGHVSFSDGQVINLPIGARPPARTVPPSSPAKKSSNGLLALVGLVLAGLATAAGSSKGKAT